MKVLCLVGLLVIISCASNTKASKNEAAESSRSVDSVSVAAIKNSEPWVIDLNKSYPHKDLVLQDIAEVNYIPIETNDSMLWQGRDVAYWDGNLMIAGNDHSGIMVYDGKGKALHAFNRKGNGPKEYIGVDRICYDREKDDLFVLDMLTSRILVYNLKGDFKRSFSLPYTGAHKIKEIVNFGPDELLAYVYDNVFVRLSKENGKVLEEKNFRKGKNNVSLMITGENNFRANVHTSSLLPSVSGGYLAAAYTSDTLYRVTPGNHWVAIGTRTPEVSKTDPLEFVRPLLETPRYCFVFSVKRMWDMESNTGFPMTAYWIDKTNNQVYEYEKVSDANCEGSSIALDHFAAAEKGWGVSCYYTLGLLKALEQGKLKGKLKEIAEKLNPEDNPVLVLVKFKE